MINIYYNLFWWDDILICNWRVVCYIVNIYNSILVFNIKISFDHTTDMAIKLEQNIVKVWNDGKTILEISQKLISDQRNIKKII